MLLLPVVLWAVLLAAGYWPTQAHGGRDAVRAMLIGQAVVVGVVYATLISTLSRIARAEPHQHLRLSFQVAAWRFILTLAAAALALWRGLESAPVFLIWLAITYVVLVQVETLALVAWMKSDGKQSC